MAEVLHVANDVTSVRSLEAPLAVADPATARLIEATVAEAADRARREGEAAGRQAAVQDVAQAVSAVHAGLDRVTAELAEQRELASAANLEMIATVAQAVLERTPPDEALTVLDRVRRAVDLLDADRLQVRVSPKDHAALADHADDPRLELVADPAIAPGEATVGTAIAGAQLTRQALVEAALRAIAEEPS